MWVECEGVLGVSWRVKLGGGDWDPGRAGSCGFLVAYERSLGVDELGGVNLGKGRCDRLEEVKKVSMHTH